MQKKHLRAGLLSLLILMSSHVTGHQANDDQIVNEIDGAKGKLSDALQIDSRVLGYKLQYQVYTPPGSEGLNNLPTIYFTDGQWYLTKGDLVSTLDREIINGNIKPVVAVFLDSRNPDDLSENRRNSEFMCNQTFATFFVRELVPVISRDYTVSANRQDRVIAGVSFGGLNAACFGLMVPDTFAGIGMHSPANSKHLKLLTELYEKQEALPLKMFFSTGTKNDNTRAARRFHTTLQEKGYPVNYIEVPFGHNWENWRPLVDDLLMTFFSGEQPSS
jgi:enterochelin esterase-like enzyme